MRPIALTMFLALTAAAAQAGSIAPHRAVYDLSLLRVSEGAGLTTAEGRLAFEVQGSTCEGWTVNFRMANRFSPSDGEVKMVDTQSTAYESGDYLEMHYNQKEFVNGALREESRVKVNRPAVGAEGSGERSAAGAKPFTIPAETFFPTQHQLKLMELAERGETRDSSLIFDGSDEDKLYRAITFIGTRKAPGSNSRDSGNPVAKELERPGVVAGFGQLLSRRGRCRYAGLPGLVRSLRERRGHRSGHGLRAVRACRHAV